MAESPVRVYYSEDPRFAQLFVGRLREQLNDRGSQVAHGLAEDWGDYMERVGFIKGLEEAVRLAEQTDKDLRGDTNARRTA